MVNIALGYAARGWHVFPVVEGGKTPAGGLVPRGHNEASTDPETIARWWSERPAANVGLACGTSGLYAVDIDCKPGVDGRASWTALIAEHGDVPRTYRVRTWSGGEHLYFRMPSDPLTNTSGKMGPGIDTRGNGYVVAPPSIVEGAPYVVLDDVEPAPLPEWIDRLCRKQDVAPVAPSGPVAESGEVLGRVRALATELAAAPEGAGNDTANRVAFMVGQYVGAGQLGTEEALDVLLDAVAGWSYRDHGGAASMRSTIIRALADGANDPRPWAQARARDPEIAAPLGEPDVEQEDPETERVVLLDSLAGLEADARTKAARSMVEQVAARDLPAVEWQDWRDWFVGETGLTKGDVDAIERDARARAKEARREAEAAERAARRAAERARVEEEGRLLPPPSAPLRVARALVASMPSTDGVAHHAFWRGDYFAWTGTHWADREEAWYRHRLYAATEHATFEDANGDIHPWDPDTAGINRVLDAMATGILLREGEREADRAIACTNGVLDLRSRTLIPHHPRLFNRNVLPYAFEPDAQCPAWLQFLGSVLPGDAGAVGFLQEWFGYVISGRTDLQKIANLVGPPRCGKGTIARVLTDLLGPDNVAASDINKLGGQFDLASLIGRQLVTMGDVRWTGREVARAVPVLLGISGEDRQTIPRKNREDWHGTLGVRFMLMSNDAPTFSDASSAMARRMIHLVFTETFLGREDTSLGDRLRAELPGILNWALDGLERLTARGRFVAPESSRALDEDVVRSASPIAAFVEEVCEQERGAEVNLDILYRAYREWCSTEGREHVATKDRFAKDLRSAYPKLTSERRGTGQARYRAIVGLALPASHFVSP